VVDYSVTGRRWPCYVWGRAVGWIAAGRRVSPER
jgi:hypothetical protein